VYIDEETQNLSVLTKNLLREYGIRPSRRLGQNFLVDPMTIEKLVDYAEIKPTEIILEVGPGLGHITEALLKEARTVITVELDPRLVRVLNNRFQFANNLKILEGDVLSIKIPKFDKAVSAPPYEISSPLIFSILKYSFDTAVLILQKEFAERLTAYPGKSEYSRLSVMTQIRAETEILDSVSRQMFYPEPTVTSAIIRLSPRHTSANITNQHIFEELVKNLFGQRKRKLRKAILPFLKYSMKLEREQIDEVRRALPMMSRRVTTLTPEDFVTLANAISETMPS